jgi:hypothetical protein
MYPYSVLVAGKADIGLGWLVSGANFASASSAHCDRKRKFPSPYVLKYSGEYVMACNLEICRCSSENRNGLVFSRKICRPSKMSAKVCV